MACFVRLAVACIPLSFIAACYGPHTVDTQDTEGGTDTDPTATGDAGTDSTPTSTTVADDSTSTTADTDTAGTDFPPELLTFTVNGEDAQPPEVSTNDFVDLRVTAMDDIGIDRIEFFDAGELIATDTEPPYQAEVLVTSADNGSHTYSATVYDTTEQTAHSTEIPLSVNINGGEMFNLREDILTFRSVITNGVKVEVADEGPIVVSGTVDGGAAVRYTSGLSQLWSRDYTDALMIGRPSVSTDGSQIHVGGLDYVADGNFSRAVFVLDVDSGSLTDTFTYPTDLSEPNELIGARSAVGTNGDVFVATGLNEVTRLNADLQAQMWAAEVDPDVADVFISDIRVSPGDALVAAFSAPGCTASNDSCVRVFSSDGAVLWTRASAGDSPPPVVAVGPNGEIATATSGSDLSLIVYDAMGNTLAEPSLVTAMAGTSVVVRDIVFDAQGHLVLVATLLDSNGRYAWAGRYRLDGSEIWSQTFELTPDDTDATGVATAPDASIYICGFQDRFNIDFFEFEAPAWVAQLTP